ncbi:hypothetical protein AU106_gp039 [Sinorhizobium phage phiM9]|uniref:Uncharacterized protein n=1 Tax=Sinorhizobium phage phiM9 TaxID=1636182 RepID=A0A0F6R5R7_9CAUD|nr:hypothetical protein AU106_gp039 [Sinorhizobium phage phiM9]AKE44670.1 hypothetical protein Sm_phiM9_040 [Sinorhizobium phage phiM9]
MSTEVCVSGSDEVVAVRFFGGRERGVMMQMEVNEVEWEAWRNVMVTFGHSDEPVRFEDFVNEQMSNGVTVVWDNAARQNQMAREFENNRFASQMPVFQAMADQARQRARVMVRDSMRSVR